VPSTTEPDPTEIVGVPVVDACAGGAARHSASMALVAKLTTHAGEMTNANQSLLRITSRSLLVGSGLQRQRSYSGIRTPDANQRMIAPEMNELS
jgi:hypothetical protein